MRLPTQVTALRLLRQVSFLEDPAKVRPSLSHMRACGDCSSGKLEKRVCWRRESVENRLKERRYKEQGFEENERCNGPLDVRTADSTPGADESRDKWRGGREMKRSTQNDGDERERERQGGTVGV